MNKIAFIFPGQGAQYTGMGQDFYETYPVAKEVFDLASRVSGLDMEQLCFTENEQLNITEYTQIAMLTAEVAMLQVIREKGLKADVCAGLSLGEYGALAAAGVMDLEDLFKVIRKRGIYMQEAYPVGGAMSAVLGLDPEQVKAVCDQTEGIVSVANYNCPGQIVITGVAEAVERAGEGCKAAGAKRVIPLKVSGPFHSALLQDAGEKLGEVLQNIEVRKPEIPYVCNVSADYVCEAEPVKDLLKQQICSSVCWQQSMERLIADGVDTFIEIGPGKTLTGFLKKIDKEVTAINIEKVEDLEKLADLL